MCQMLNSCDQLYPYFIIFLAITSKGVHKYIVSLLLLETVPLNV